MKNKHITEEQLSDFINHKMNHDEYINFTLHLFQCEACLGLAKIRQTEKINRKLEEKLVSTEMHLTQTQTTTTAIAAFVEKIKLWLEKGAFVFKTQIDDVKHIMDILNEEVKKNWSMSSIIINKNNTEINSNLAFNTRTLSDSGDVSRSDSVEIKINHNLNPDIYKVHLAHNTINVEANIKQELKNKKILLITYDMNKMKNIDTQNTNFFILHEEANFKKKKNKWFAQIKIFDNEKDEILTKKYEATGFILCLK